MQTALASVIAAVVAFIVGSGMMLDAWEKSAERGIFEIGHVVYRVERVQP